MMKIDVSFCNPNRFLGMAMGWTIFLIENSLRSAELPDSRPLPAAKQIGVSCGFFANIPTVTLATGVDIHTSESFVKSIYGLRRGDLSYQSSFDKRMFYELFSLPYVQTRITHPPGSPQDILEKARMIVTEVFHDGLAKRQVYSIRVRGVFNGPHNALLIGRHGDDYILHDPFPGTFETVSLDQLASRMLVKSTLKKNRGKVIYVTHYLTIDLPVRPQGQIIPVSSLPITLDASLSERQRSRISAMLRTEPKLTAGAKIDQFISAYPNLDFAALPSDGKNGKSRNVIHEDLKTKDLAGLLNLAKFTLNTWHMKRRPLMPVLVIDGQPQVLISYRAPDQANPAAKTLVFDDGNNLLSITPDEALDKIRKSGAIYATLKLETD